MNIGFIGTGIMGLPMAGHLLKAGHRVRVYNRTRSKTIALEDLGAEIVDTPQSAAENADLLITIVSRTEDVQQVLLGEKGAAHGAPAGCLFVDMSTIDANASVQMEQSLNAKGFEFMDAPVSGGEGGAVNAALTIFIGGSDVNLERATPVLKLLGKKLNHMGACGAGQTAKACNQILVCGALLGVAEALSYGLQRNLDLSQLVDATSGGAAQSWQLENLGAAMAKGDFDPGFMIDLLHKDVAMILEDIKINGGELPATNLLNQRLERLIEQGQGKLGTQAVYKTFIVN